MRLRESLEAVANASPEAFEDLRRSIDPAWILQALEATGTATVRSRRLPAEQVVWLVIGMPLFGNRSIQDIVTKLDLALPGVVSDGGTEQRGGGTRPPGRGADGVAVRNLRGSLGARERTQPRLARTRGVRCRWDDA